MKNDQLKGRAVCYIRVSSDEQVQGTSLDTQKEACENYCISNGLEVDRIFRGEGESAKMIDRPELQELLAYCRKNKGKITHLVIYKIDRLSRNVFDYHYLINEFTKMRISVKSVTEQLENSPAGEMHGNMLAVFAQFDNRQRTERCVNGMREKIRQGIWPLPTPIGYMPFKKLGAKEKKLIPDIPNPDEFDIIKKGFEFYLTGNYSMAEVARKLTVLFSGKRRIYPQLMKYILSNKYYCGILTDPWDKSEHQGQHMPMITKDDFIKVQRIMQAKGRKIISKKWVNPDFPLRGFIRCGDCYNFYTGSWSKGRNMKCAYYHCYTKICGHYGKSIPKGTLENDFLAYLGQISPKQKYMSSFWNAVLKVSELKYKEVNAEFLRYEKKLASFQQYRHSIVQKNATGVLPDEEFKEELAKVKGEIEMAELAMSETKLDIFQKEAVLEYTKNFMSNLPRQWFDLGIEGKRRFQKLLFPDGLPYLGNGKFGTAKLCVIFEINQQFQKGKTNLVDRAGFEPAASAVQKRRSTK